jgi:glycosyltransferase involved in cell wall biosynthesis
VSAWESIDWRTFPTFSVRSDLDDALASPGLPLPLRGPRIRVGFGGVSFSAAGGTETWHGLLLSRLDRTRLEPVGFVATDDNDATRRNLDALRPYCRAETGGAALARLALEVDVLVLWGLADPGRYLEPRGSARRPRLTMVSHGDAASEWSITRMHGAAPDADRYVGVSRGALDTIPSYRRSDALVISNGYDPRKVEPTRTREAMRAEWGLGPGDVAVGYLGRLSLEKRPELAIGALRHLSERFKLIIAGDGWAEDRARAAAVGLDDRVRWLGYRPDSANVLAGLDLLVSPSDTEGFGLTMAEAMAYGVPVLATPLGVAGDNPQLVRTVPVEAGPEAWAAAIADDWEAADARRARVVTARDVVRARYSAERFAAAWGELIEAEGRLHRELLTRPAADVVAAMGDDQRRRVAECGHRRIDHDAGCCGPVDVCGLGFYGGKPVQTAECARCVTARWPEFALAS